MNLCSFSFTCCMYFIEQYKAMQDFVRKNHKSIVDLIGAGEGNRTLAISLEG